MSGTEESFRKWNSWPYYRRRQLQALLLQKRAFLPPCMAIFPSLGCFIIAKLAFISLCCPDSPPASTSRVARVTRPVPQACTLTHFIFLAKSSAPLKAWPLIMYFYCTPSRSGTMLGAHSIFGWLFLEKVVRCKDVSI